MLLVAAVSFSSLLLLTFNRFDSAKALILGLMSAITIWKFCRLEFRFLDSRFDAGILLVILLALFFRSEPYLYVLGGQDQGIYVNMSAAYEKNGSTFLFDGVREQLNTDTEKEYYDKHNQFMLFSKDEDQYEGQHVPGIYVKDLHNSEYVFQFYPLHPLWMAIFGRSFGSENRVYSLVFFSLISVISFYLLAYELSGHQKIPAYLVSTFLAVNPLHVFFSKFPVTEIVALAFTSSGFYFLVCAYRSHEKEWSNVFLFLLSASMFGCFFFTRITGFMYLPFFYILLCAALLWPNPMVRHFFYYFLSITILYAISVCYGLYYSYPYVTHIYNISFGKIITADRWLHVLVAGVGALAILGLLAFSQKNARLRVFCQNLWTAVSYNLHIIFFIIIAFSIYKIYQLGFTDCYIGDSWMDERWGVAGVGWKAVPFSTLLVTILYLSPCGFIILLFALNKYRKINNLVQFLVIFLIFFVFAVTVVIFVIPYQYYYARYLLTEVVPYSLLLISLYFTTLISGSCGYRLISYTLISCMFIYFSYYSSFQFLGKECDGAHVSLKRISANLDDRDLLFISRENFDHFWPIYTSLSVYYGCSVFGYDKISNFYNILQDEILKHNDTFILSSKIIKTNITSIVDEVAYKQGVFEHVTKIPTHFSYIKSPFYLYRINKVNLMNASFHAPGGFIPSRYPATLENFHADNIWTRADSSITGLNCKINGKERYFIISTYGWSPNDRDFNLDVFINNEKLNFSHCSNNCKDYYFFLPKTNEICSIRFLVNTFIPSKKKINDDNRELGLDIATLRIK